MAKPTKPGRQSSAGRTPDAKRLRARDFPAEKLILAIGLLVACAVFIYQARSLWFTQDDAFISYRYAANVLRGEGLVFNAGEHVEGYTNFLWVILLVLAGSFNLAFDPVAKFLGIASGLGLIILTGLWVRAAWQELRWGNGVGPAVAAALLVAGNGSVAYWSVSGLETAWFAFWVGLAVWWWVRRSSLTIPALTIACLSRPEGALIWGLLVLAEWVWGEGLPNAIRLAAGIVLLLPFAVFKIWYYGSLLPNPFYARTGLGLEYLQSGFDYAWLYLRQYGFFGVAALLAVLSLRILPRRWRTIPAIWLVYLAYIVFVGGDVLKAHRFFVPGTVLLAISSIVALGWIARRFTPELARIRDMELSLVSKMSEVAENLKETDQSNFSIAVSTIGRVSFGLLGHCVIDMLGLTDSTVARHPEAIPGNVSTWRERNYNATYILSRDPDYILFSTGHKPSAPAERALIVHKKFRRNYYTLLFTPRGGVKMLAISHRKGVYQGTDEVWPSIQLAHDLNNALNLMMSDKFQESFDRFSKIQSQGPGDFPTPYMFMAEILRKSGQADRALLYADSALSIDSLAVMAWWEKAVIYATKLDAEHLRTPAARIQKMAPWLKGTY
ncbi:MAG: hypothetical protein HZB43_10140 [candidate division Zixibacteria bacterium]|nr:hypothetical protein [candidate division Zixibacteria bacterium]